MEVVITATPPAAGEDGPIPGGSLTSAMSAQGIRGFESWQDTTGNETHVYTALYDTLGTLRR